MDKSELHTNLIRVLLVDDDLEMQAIIKTILSLAGDIELIGTGANGKGALALCEKMHPDILLLDVLMPVMDGIEAAGLLRKKCPDIKILALSSAQDLDNVHAMLKNGVNGYISKTQMLHGLAENIRAVYHGTNVFSDEAFSHLIPPEGKPAKSDFNLTSREREILVLMAAGLNRPMIAARLDISATTVKTHIENICAKLEVRTQLEAIHVAAKNNLV